MNKHKNIIGIKDCSGKDNVIQYISERTENKLILSGDDGNCIHFLNIGGNGLVSVTSNIFPSLMLDYINGKNTDQEKLNEVASYMFIAPNPVAVKYALFNAGLIASPSVRKPLCQMPDDLKQQLSTFLNNQ